MKKSLSLVAIVAIVGIALFFVGRFTAPKQEVSRQPEIDSLKSDLKAREAREKLALDSMAHYKTMADSWYNQAQEAKKGKIVIVTKYRNEIKAIDRLSTRGIDSALLKRYGADSVK